MAPARKHHLKGGRRHHQQTDATSTAADGTTNRESRPQAADDGCQHRVANATTNRLTWHAAAKKGCRQPGRATIRLEGATTNRLTKVWRGRGGGGGEQGRGKGEGGGGRVERGVGGRWKGGEKNEVAALGLGTELPPPPVAQRPPAALPSLHEVL